MSTSFHGVTSFNQKVVTVTHNPGWGEPEEWYLTFDNGTSLVINNPEGMGKNQLDYLQRLTADKYREEILQTNWAGIGNVEDVIKTVLDYVGYNEVNSLKDYRTLHKFNVAVDQSLQDIAEGLHMNNGTIDHVIRDLEKMKNMLAGIRDQISVVSYRLDVYRKLQKNEPVGIGWNNATLFANYKDTTWGKLAGQYL